MCWCVFALTLCPCCCRLCPVYCWPPLPTPSHHTCWSSGYVSVHTHAPCFCFFPATALMQSRHVHAGLPIYRAACTELQLSWTTSTVQCAFLSLAHLFSCPFFCSCAHTTPTNHHHHHRPPTSQHNRSCGPCVSTWRPCRCCPSCA